MIFRSLILCFFCVWLWSCSVSERVVSEDREGEIPESIFDELKNGKTTQDWVERSLGKPTETESVLDSFVTVTYAYKRSEYKQARALLVFNYSGVESKQEYLHLVYVDGRLEKHWRDEFEVIRPHKIEKFVRRAERQQERDKKAMEGLVKEAEAQKMRLNESKHASQSQKPSQNMSQPSSSDPSETVLDPVKVVADPSNGQNPVKELPMEKADPDAG